MKNESLLHHYTHRQRRGIKCSCLFGNAIGSDIYDREFSLFQQSYKLLLFRRSSKKIVMPNDRPELHISKRNEDKFSHPLTIKMLNVGNSDEITKAENILKRHCNPQSLWHRTIEIWIYFKKVWLKARKLVTNIWHKIFDGNGWKITLFLAILTFSAASLANLHNIVPNFQKYILGRSSTTQSK